MKKSIRKIERRTRGRDIVVGGLGSGILIGGEGRMRLQLIAANDETTHVWRTAA